MMIIMNVDATPEQVEAVVEKIGSYGFKAHLSQGEERTVIGVVGNEPITTRDQFLFMPGIARIIPISRPYKLASREFIPQNTVFPAGNVPIGGEQVVIAAGCSLIEGRTQWLETAQAAKEAGAQLLYGGTFVPYSSPYSLHGLGETGLELLAEARQATGLPVMTEVVTPEQVAPAARYADLLQINANNMQNYALLHAAGECSRPVLIKRSNSGSIEELLMAAEYVLSHGNRSVIVCECGIRSFETHTHNTTDINAIPVLKALTHLPVFLAPSESTGHWEYVAPVALAAAAAGADGLLVAVHPNPEDALLDGNTMLKPERFAALVAQVRAMAGGLGRG
ncbi:MAG: 3-deoxy-7-phosphoheptulonate synthase [Chloroflexi bacterium]|nr:3-deoxy-7-phosphoheptulonate synthase [Anaerolineaceae bacterium]NMB90155.1 3-deoxy-7-phosphoheptulonate synthase [Chloroflexota bacterium]